MDIDIEDSALLNAILDAAADAIIVADAHGIVHRANPAARALFQYSRTDMIGNTVNMLMPRKVAQEHDGYMRHHIETGENRIIGIGREVEGQRRDGTVFPLHLSIGETTAAGNRMFVGILHDLTRQKSAEAALARSQRLEAIGQMTGGIAHDFNNLLTVMIGNLELLEMRNAQDSNFDLIKDALDAAELGADLTSRLMVFARKSDLKPVEADLRQLCEDALSILRRMLGSGIVIKTEFARQVDKVLIDPSQLQSAILNLALNARDAMDGNGELLISVTNVRIDDSYIAQETDIAAGDYVRLSVSDNGAGMNAEAQKRAFEPFFTTKAENGGTGLGLAMVYGFVRQSGGHITLYSEQGLGTSFGLYFPATGTVDDGDLAASGSDTEGPGIAGRGKRILVVEDNPRVRKLSVERIRDLGFEVIEAESGDAAYALLQSGTKVDAVFSDLVMPGTLNGYDLAALIASEFPDIKVLLTSGYASDVVTSGLAKGQPRDILHKPYRQIDLAQRLQALFADDDGG
ncbi:PAS domain S-box protein [Marimonas sp. MJW-29]|uniref:histidine kinase n=1 Tax=Sulfitobacter sediminis TaxID=3234186 RepID=A0ABV3RPV4_9RHOB